jgi:uncharacterized DUF497 family protein
VVAGKRVKRSSSPPAGRCSVSSTAVYTVVHTAMFDWDNANTDHIGLHGVTIEESEEALLDRHRIFDQTQFTDERRWAVIGRTETGRVLVVVFTRRGSVIRVVTARDALPRERRRYRRR